MTKDEEVIVHSDEDDHVPDDELDRMKQEMKQAQSLSAQFRRELENYLGDMDAKVDSEGHALIEKPSNFNDIVKAMTREDLVAEDRQKAWFSTLIQDAAENEAKGEYGGRYKGMGNNSPEKKIKKGMAEIMLMDRQLWVLNKRIKEIDESGRPPSSFPPQSPNTTPSSPLPPASAPRSSRAAPRGGKWEEDGLVEEEASIPGTPQSRTFITKVMGSRGGRGESGLSEKDQPSRRPATPPSPSSPSSPAQVPFYANIDERVAQLLQVDDYNNDTDTYGKNYADENKAYPTSFLSEEDAAALGDIDQQLSVFGRAEATAASTEGRKLRGDQYLAEQREERIMREKNDLVDRMLRGVTSNTSDLTYLLPLDSDSSHAAPPRHTQRSNLLQPPTFDELAGLVSGGGRLPPVTRADLELLYRNLAEEEVGGDRDPKISEDDNDVTGKDKNHHAREADGTRSALLDLLSTYSDQVDRLEALRSVIISNQQHLRKQQTISGKSAVDNSKMEGFGDEDHWFAVEASEKSPNLANEDKGSVDLVFDREDLQSLQSYFNRPPKPQFNPPSSHRITKDQQSYPADEDLEYADDGGVRFPPIYPSASQAQVNAANPPILPSSRRVWVPSKKEKNNRVAEVVLEDEGWEDLEEQHVGHRKSGEKGGGGSGSVKKIVI